MPPPGIEPATPCFPQRVTLKKKTKKQKNTRLSGEISTCCYRTFTVLFDQTILQELCIVCKGYVENKSKRTLFIYSFVIDTI